MTKKCQAPQGPSPDTDLTCQQVTALLVDYVAEDMAAPIRTVFEAHLRGCPECTTFLATYRETIRVTRSIRYEAIPEEMLARVLRFLHRKITGTSRNGCGEY